MKILPILTLALILLSGCDRTDPAAFLKASLKDSCGADQAGCVQAVEEQFPECHEKYQQQWQAYLSASGDAEAQALRAYSRRLYGCITHESGKPYFFYNNES
jgi:hypothetical protein